MSDTSGVAQTIGVAHAIGVAQTFDVAVVNTKVTEFSVDAYLMRIVVAKPD